MLKIIAEAACGVVLLSFGGVAAIRPQLIQAWALSLRHVSVPRSYLASPGYLVSVRFVGIIAIVMGSIIALVVSNEMKQ